jgi:hypothetical protein
MWLMTAGFLLYTLLILAGHIAGFPLSFAYLRTICQNGCSLTTENVQALKSASLSIDFYVNLYETIQVIYVLVTAGIALLIVFKKPGQWVPLGMSGFLLGLSAYEGADYPALAAAYPVLAIPSQFLIGLGMGILGMYALLTFPNGKFGSRWILGYYLFQAIEGMITLFFTNPIISEINGVLGLLSFPLILVILIYRYLRLLNAKERTAIKWIILNFSIFILVLLVVYLVVPIVVPTDSLTLVFINMGGFFGCGINIAGFLMAVLYANAFDIDIFVRRTLVYTLLTATLVLLYTGLVLGSQFGLATFNVQAAQSPLLLVGSTLIVAALFQPLRHRLQRLVDRRFYRQKYDAGRVIASFGSHLHNEVNLAELSEQLVGVVRETMQPASVSLWLRKPTRAEQPEDELL